MTVYGWVMKLWGDIGTVTACGTSVKPAGYVVFTTAPFNITGASSTCTTNSQWLYVEPGATAGNIVSMKFSSIYLAISE